MSPLPFGSPAHIRQHCPLRMPGRSTVYATAHRSQQQADIARRGRLLAGRLTACPEARVGAALWASSEERAGVHIPRVQEQSKG